MRSQLALRISREETSSAQHAFCLFHHLICHFTRDTLMSAQFLQNIYLESSKHKNSTALPVLLTFHNSLLKNVSRYRMDLCLWFRCWLWESLHSSNKDNPQSNPVSLNLTITAMAELDLRGWVRSPCETHGALLPRLATARHSQSGCSLFFGCVQDIGRSSDVQICAACLYTDGKQHEETRNIFELIMSIWAFDMFVDMHMPTYKHTHVRKGSLQSLESCSALFGCGQLDM